MRSLIPLAALVFATSASAAEAPSVAPPKQARFTPPAEDCRLTQRYHADREGKRLAPRNLAELPPANAYSAVYRLVDGCETPVVVQYGLGSR